MEPHSFCFADRARNRVMSLCEMHRIEISLAMRQIMDSSCDISYMSARGSAFHCISLDITARVALPGGMCCKCGGPPSPLCVI